MADEVYVKLRELLDTLPAGFPATDSGVEIRLLKKLFSPEDAEMALCLTWELESPAEIAARCGVEESAAAERLESMARRGLIYRERCGDQVLYRIEQYVIGIYEMQGHNMDRELAELIEEYYPCLGISWFPIKTAQMRVIPVASAFDSTPAIATYDRVRELIREKEPIVKNPCICRMQQAALGNRCERPTEGDIGFGRMARFFLDNGWGTQIDAEEAMRLLDKYEEDGLVLQTDNAADIGFVCSCCSCCCPPLRSIKAFPAPGKMVQSNYRARRNDDLCVACGTCVERCPMEAVVETEEGVQFDPARCIGCGVCLSTCPEEAITLEPRKRTRVPPPTYDDALRMISAERGLA